MGCNYDIDMKVGAEEDLAFKLSQSQPVDDWTAEMGTSTSAMDRMLGMFGLGN